MEMWITILIGIGSAILAIIGSAAWFRKFVGKLGEAGQLAKEVSDVLLKAKAILEDSKITPTEVEEFIVEINEVRDALKELFSKEIEE